VASLSEHTAIRVRADVVELVKAGTDISRARSFLVAHAAPLVPLLERAIEEARAEEE
jgi:hypothetical protein